MQHQVRAAAPQAVALAHDGEQVVHQRRPVARVVDAGDLGEHQRQEHRELRGRRYTASEAQWSIVMFSFPREAGTLAGGPDDGLCLETQGELVEPMSGLWCGWHDHVLGGNNVQPTLTWESSCPMTDSSLLRTCVFSPALMPLHPQEGALIMLVHSVGSNAEQHVHSLRLKRGCLRADSGVCLLSRRLRYRRASVRHQVTYGERARTSHQGGGASS